MQSDTQHTVLVAEDEAEMIALYEHWLQDFEVIAVRNGREALAHLSDAVDVLLCDRRMPHVTGPEVVARLDATDLDIPVIVVSSCRPDAALGRDDVARYLRKPVERDAVVDAVREVLG